MRTLMPTLRSDNKGSGFHLRHDFLAALSVQAVAIPFSIGIAEAAQASPWSGVVASVVGGLVAALAGKGRFCITAPSAGLSALFAYQAFLLGSYPALLAAVMVAGFIQIVLSWLKVGVVAAFLPTGVIKGLLAATAFILILKQVPHLLGHDPDAEGEMSFIQADHRNTFTELLDTTADIHLGAALVGIVCLAIYLLWRRYLTERTGIPAALVTVGVGVGVSEWLSTCGPTWSIVGTHLLNVPKASSPLGWLTFPDVSALAKPEVLWAAFILATVATLETLMSLTAVDKLVPAKSETPANRELLAQGLGNVGCGILGGLPITVDIIRSSTGIYSGSQSKGTAIMQALILALGMWWLPQLLNHIPLACFAAVLIAIGTKLLQPSVCIKMWHEGAAQFWPFAVTFLGILFTNPLYGLLAGLAVSVFFILHSNLRRPLHRVVEHHVSGDILRIELANQVSFLNRGVIRRTLSAIEPGSQVILDARGTDYIDPDVLDMIHDFRLETAPARNLKLSLVGFDQHANLVDQVDHIDYTTREVQNMLTPAAVLDILMKGNARFVKGQKLTRDLKRQVGATSAGQYPLAVVLSCIDSRSPVELLFDLGLGDAFVARIAGNVAKDKVLGSMEFGCAVAGAKLIMVMGHTSCGAVKAAVDLFGTGQTAHDATGCKHLNILVDEIQCSIQPGEKPESGWADLDEKLLFVDTVAARNVVRTVDYIRRESDVLRQLELDGKIKIVGAMYDIKTGLVELL
jgi:carbonic anhydrase